MSLFGRRLSRARSRSLEPQAAYAEWADSYPPRAHNALMQVEQSAMEACLRSIVSSRALDVGTGTGRYLDVLEDSGVARHVGIDLSEAMLARARGGGSRLVRGDARALPFARGAFDLVVASLMAGDIQDLALWAREMSRVLCPGGALLYSDFHPSWAERGWKRTFRNEDGISRSVSYHPHTLGAHRAALKGAHLRILKTTEPLLEHVAERPVCVVFLAGKREA